MTTLQDLRILAQVVQERTRQDAKWGEQNHPSGTGGYVRWAAQIARDDDASTICRTARRDTDNSARNGGVTWRQILLEEVAEAFAEAHDPWSSTLSAELTQVAAVAISWLGALERRDIHFATERVYLSGPISGVPDAADRFRAAALDVAYDGKDPVNPFDIEPLSHAAACPDGYSPGDTSTVHTSSTCFMRTDLLVLLGCDSILMLEDWWHSRGARLERDVALAVGMPVAYADGHDGQPS